MQMFITRQYWRTYYTKVSQILEVTALLFSAVTMLIALFDNNLSMKLFNVCGIVAVLALIVRGKNCDLHWKKTLLPITIFLIGIVDVIWYELFKTNTSPFRATYHSYINTARIFIFGAFIVFLASTSRVRITKDKILYIIYSLSFFIFLAALYQKITTGAERIDFGVGTATGAAYSIMLVGLISATSIFYTQKNHLLLFITNAVIILAALVMTQTRSSIIIFPVICLITLAFYYSKSPKKLFIGVCSFVTLLIAIGLFFSKPIIERYEAAVKDITLYQQNYSNTSLGARLAMYEVGMKLFQDDPLTWRSAEERAEKTQEMIKSNPGLRSVNKFLNIHLHNEVVENASLKGLIGVLTLIAFYAALLFSVYYFKSIELFAFTLAIIGTGLSDVIIWSRSIPIIVICGITIIMLFNKRTLNQ